jgi:PAS domain S-box-containing protein
MRMTIIHLVQTGLKTLFLLLLASGSLFAASAPASLPPMRIGFEAEANPLSFVGPDGRPVGYSVDLVDAIAREMGFSIVATQAPWEKIFAQFKAGEIDVLPSLVYTTERDAFIDYSVPHLQLKGTAFLRRDLPPLRDGDDLRNLRVAVQRDSFSHVVMRRHDWDRHPVYLDTLEGALRAVADNRCDVVLAVGLVGQKIIRELKLTNVVASAVEFPELSFDLHLAVRAGESDRLALLNAGLARIRANGVYNRIHEKWIGPLEPRAVRLKDIRLYLVPGLIAGLALAAAFIWQRRVLKLARAQAEALRSSEERLHLVLECGGHGLWDWNFETGHIERTDHAAELIGYAHDEIDQQHQGWMKLVHPDDRGAIAEIVARTNRPGEDVFFLEYRMHAKDGSWHWIVSRGRIVSRKPDGAARRAVGTHTDITHLKHAESQRAQLQEKMLEAQKLESLGVLAGGIAHDFNNLLAVILGNASLAKFGAPPGDTAIALSLTQIETAARRASDLCRQMLAYAGHGTLARERLNLSTVINHTTELLRLSISKAATLHFDLQPDTPWIEADRSQLQQIVMNLVINASESLGTAGGTIRLATGRGHVNLDDLVNAVHRPEKIAGEFAWLDVSDTGCGMTAETRAKIFEPFFTTKFTGRGLGLAAVLGIVRAHHGIFIVRSEPGRGSTFRIYFPAADPAVLFAAPLAPAPAYAPGGTVLVADDEPAVLAMVGAALKKHGFSVVTARDGREAVEKFSAQPGAFFLVLLDLTMPVLDGAHALREIRDLQPGIPLLVMSGYSQQAALAKLRAAGRVDFLAKPFSTEELLVAIAQAQKI